MCYFAILIFGIGVMSAASPLIAAERGRNRHAVREVRRTVRQGLWAALAISVPSWFVLWHGEAILLVHGAGSASVGAGGLYLRTLEWGMLPFLGYLVLRVLSRRDGAAALGACDRLRRVACSTSSRTGC